MLQKIKYANSLYRTQPALQPGMGEVIARSGKFLVQAFGGVKSASLDLKRSEAHWDYIGLRQAKLSAGGGFAVGAVRIWRHDSIGIREISDVVHTRWWNSGKGIRQMIWEKSYRLVGLQGWNNLYSHR